MYTQPQRQWKGPGPKIKPEDRPRPNVVYLIEHEYPNRAQRRKSRKRGRPYPSNYGNGRLERKEE